VSRPPGIAKSAAPRGRQTLVAAAAAADVRAGKGWLPEEKTSVAPAAAERSTGLSDPGPQNRRVATCLRTSLFDFVGMQGGEQCCFCGAGGGVCALFARVVRPWAALGRGDCCRCAGEATSPGPVFPGRARMPRPFGRGGRQQPQPAEVFAIPPAPNRSRPWQGTEKLPRRFHASSGCDLRASSSGFAREVCAN